MRKRKLTKEELENQLNINLKELLKENEEYKKLIQENPNFLDNEGNLILTIENTESIYKILINTL